MRGHECNLHRFLANFGYLCCIQSFQKSVLEELDQMDIQLLFKILKNSTVSWHNYTSLNVGQSMNQVSFNNHKNFQIFQKKKKKNTVKPHSNPHFSYVLQNTQIQTLFSHIILLPYALVTNAEKRYGEIRIEFTRWKKSFLYRVIHYTRYLRRKTKKKKSQRRTVHASFS